jgi:hypothetical protein
VRVMKNSRPFINAIFLIICIGTFVNAQEQPTEMTLTIAFFLVALRTLVRQLASIKSLSNYNRDATGG